MSGPRRLPAPPAGFGVELDAAEPASFRFAGRQHTGCYGDTLASGLLAAGVPVWSTSPRLGRPRGPMGLGVDDAALLTVGGDSGAWSAAAADEIVLREAMSARRAVAAGADPAGLAGGRALLPAVRRLTEALRRSLPLPAPRLAATRPPPPARRETCDLVVIGAGLAGLAAAAAARAAGLDVRVVEASRRAGGVADLFDGQIDGLSLKVWTDAEAAALGGALALNSTAISIGADGAVTVVERTDASRPSEIAVRALSPGAIVLATGYRERPLIFADNDRPGVVLSCAARALLRRQAIAPGERVVVATTSDDGYRTAIDLRRAGVEVGLVLDARDNPQGPAVDLAKALGVPLSLFSVVTGVEYDPARGGLCEVRAQNRFGEGVSAGARTLEADALVVSGGFAPRDELARRCGLTEAEGLFVAHTGPDAADAVAGGWAAGAAAARRLGAEPTAAAPNVDAARDEPDDGVAGYLERLDPARAGTAFVDIGADVTAADVYAAAEAAVTPGPGALARRLGLGGGLDGGRLSADLPARLFATIGAGRPPAPSPGRPTVGLLAARATAPFKADRA
ncbi:FAD-dependent oxidoreductase [Hansschlegelia beijingensis]|uniref:Sarcosine oxidase subunit alpha n=1 Tax=Hansschlegelia beijingensis TaxID=1133344 RepID=A0A7W6D2G3_9HYPH|nr:FAD-dependent oxidoreductase [Hansschlegelia beijingensis]MBB3971953.1 sarcosine oxidase subunit alpha [Hansschlegelia beijingensis]